jgi:hypothetical protein
MIGWIAKGTPKCVMKNNRKKVCGREIERKDSLKLQEKLKRGILELVSYTSVD